MDDGVYSSSIPLALLPLIGLKWVHLDSTSMVTGCVYVWIISARRDEDRAASGQSPSLHNRFGMQALSGSVAFFWKTEDWCGKKKKKKLPTGNATDMITDSAALVAMEMCSICSVT